MSEIGLSTTDTIPGYTGFTQLIGPVQVRNGDPMSDQLSDVNRLLREKAKASGGNVVLGITYKNDRGQLIATGTVFYMDKINIKPQT